MKKNKTKKSKAFKIGMLIYSLLCILGIGLLWYKVWDLVDVYEQELPEYAMEDYMKKFNDSYFHSLVLKNSDVDVSEFEDAEEIAENYIQWESCKDLSYVKKTGYYTNTEPVYSVLKNGTTEIAEVHFKEKPSGKGRDKWELTEEIVEGVSLKGEESITVSVPENSQVYINDVLVDEKYITGTTEEAELLKNVEKYIDNIPKLNIYTVKGLFEQPVVKVLDGEGNEMHDKGADGSYSYGFQASEDFAAEQTPWILKMTKAYALYISNDGSFADVSGYLYPDSSESGLYYAISTLGVIWFSDHTGTEISNQTTSDFKLYGEDCFSCKVSFTQTIKGIGGTKTGGTRVNENELICIFVKVDGVWKWAGMNTLEIKK